MKVYSLLTILFLFACSWDKDLIPNRVKAFTDISSIDTNAILLKERFQPPAGYRRVKADPNSYAIFLRNLELKPHKEKVLYYNGDVKENQNVYCAVLNQTISNRNLQQCADAVMRLRGEYLFEQKRYQEIHFNFLSDNKPRYFKNYGDKSYSYKNFLKFMDYVFAFANTRSLFNELIPVKSTEMKIGDVFIQTGNPFGHAVTVMDMAENELGQKVFMLSQSYMPAQETQILINQKSSTLSPWFLLKEVGQLDTPEWVFSFSDLRRFKNE